MASPPYDSLIIAIDIGTTFSGASFAFVDSKRTKAPSIRSVSHYDGQEDQTGNTKVPSIVLYDQEGGLLACGSNALSIARARDPAGYFKVEWFKLQLKPKSIHMPDVPVIKLPPGRTLDDVFADFLGFMVGCVVKFIKETTIEGSSLLSLQHSARYILTHPNGWEGNQRDRMRGAAVRAGLVSDTPEDKTRVAFLTEGEASLHWWMAQGLTAPLKIKDQVIIADVGGGTIDVSSYAVRQESPLRLNETSTPACVLAGSVFVNQEFRKRVKEQLRTSSARSKLDMDQILHEFDRTAKRLFRGTEPDIRMRVGGVDDNDQKHGVDRGYLIVDRDTVAATFKPSCEALVKAIQDRIVKSSSPGQKTYVFLVGGFAASPYLFGYTEEAFHKDQRVQAIRRANSNTAKAVSEGAIAWYLDGIVTDRVARQTYGFTRDPPYSSSNPLHKERAKFIFPMYNGKKGIKGGFHAVVKKGEVIHGHAVHIEPIRVYQEIQATQTSHTVTFDLLRYIGAVADVQFMDQDKKDKFQKVCTYTAILPEAAFYKKWNFNFKSYFRANYDVVISLGTVDITCQVQWKDRTSGEVNRTPAMSTWEDF